VTESNDSNKCILCQLYESIAVIEERIGGIDAIFLNIEMHFGA
jgi:hypothetical protein